MQTNSPFQKRHPEDAKARASRTCASCGEAAIVRGACQRCGVVVATAPVLTILADTREQMIPPFPAGVEIQRATLGEGDYTGLHCQGVACIERKAPSDFASSLSHGRERFDDEIRRLQGYRWKLVIVEADLSYVFRITRMHPNSILGSIASLTARWDCPVIFAGNEVGCGRLIAGIISRWEQRLAAERSAP